MNKEEFEQAVGELYELTKLSKVVADKIEKSKATILPYMLAHEVSPINTHDYILQKQYYVKHREISADELRSILHKDAESLIKEVVLPKAKELLTEEQLEEYCGALSSKPYVSMTIRGDPEK